MVIMTGPAQPGATRVYKVEKRAVISAAASACKAADRLCGELKNKGKLSTSGQLLMHRTKVRAAAQPRQTLTRVTLQGSSADRQLKGTPSLTKTYVGAASGRSAALNFFCELGESAEPVRGAQELAFRPNLRCLNWIRSGSQAASVILMVHSPSPKRPGQ